MDKIIEKKPKICVYTISKNEEQNVNRWLESVKEADEIYVLDTGSTDHTVEMLRQGGCHVEEKRIDPWRFDIARNLSLDMVPVDTDICVCADLDEFFIPGWRKKIEEKWTPYCTRIRYMYQKEEKFPIDDSYLDKIHLRRGYIWKHPVYETLQYIGEGRESFEQIEDIILKHNPDLSKERSHYLPLLELSLKEDSEDNKTMYYLGREYMYHERYNEAIDTLLHHLALKKTIDKNERYLSMRLISRCYLSLKRPIEAEMWITNAIKESFYPKDAYIEKALLLYRQERYSEVIENCEKALMINKKEKSLNREFFSLNSMIDDLLGSSYYKLGNLDQAILHTKQALEYNPKSKKLQKNLEFYLKEKTDKYP